jgi:hypothetical protein
VINLLAIVLVVWLLLSCVVLVGWAWLLNKRDRDWYDNW